MRFLRFHLLCSFLALAVLAQMNPIRAEDWPGWRGPRGDGTSIEKGIPTKWGKDDNIAWKTAIPGRGHSSPVIWGDRVFLTSCLEKDGKQFLQEGKQLLLCLDRKDGKILWQQEQPHKLQKSIHGLNSHASSTPATDGKYVFVTFHDEPNYVACCYDLDGKLIWKKTPGEFNSVHGFCSTPALYQDLVILNGDQDSPKGTYGRKNSKNSYDSYLIALEKSTGAERWRVSRPYNIRSYTPPVIFDMAEKKQLVLSGSKCVASYDPETGKLNWNINDGPTEQFVSSLVYGDGVLFMTYGFPKLGYAGIRPDGQGEVKKTHLLYNVERDGGYVPSPIYHDKYFFFVNDNGIASCVDSQTGKSQWKERISNHSSASPVLADNHLYFVDDLGFTTVLKAGPKFEVVQKNELGEKSFGSPAIARGQLFIRGVNHLYCIGATK